MRTGSGYRAILERDEGRPGAEARDPELGQRPPAPPPLQHSTIARLAAEAHGERGVLALGTAALVVSTLATLSIPSFFGRVIDALAVGGGVDAGAQRRRLVAETGGLVAASLVNAVFSFLRGFLFDLAGERVVARLRKRLFAALLAQEMGFFDAARTGDLVSRLAGDTSVLRDAVTGNVSGALRLCATVIGGVAYLFAVSWKLTLAVLAGGWGRGGGEVC